MVRHNHTSILFAIFIPLTCLQVLASDGISALRTKPKSRPVSGQSRKHKPNIVFILVDDLGFNDVGYHGEGGAALKTPNIDRLAREGPKECVSKTITFNQVVHLHEAS